MGVSKVIYDGETLIDISEDTVTSENLFEGVKAHNAKGEEVEGTFPVSEVDTQADLIEQIKTALDGKSSESGENKFNLLAKRTITNVTAEDLQGVVNIPSDFFNQCYSLVSVDLPEGIKILMNSSFAYCSGLMSIEIPSTVTNLRSGVFSYCSNLQTVTFKGTPTTINTNVFLNCGSLTTINVPWSKGEVANDPWGAPNATIKYDYTGG